MTRERGRIQENANKYIVKNCPAIVISELGYHIPYCSSDITIGNCQDCTDCVIKQVIEKCEVYKNFTAITINDYAKRELAFHILDLFDIEEINK